ncbi:bifunctional riboflavin kinase/FAD synthetase [Phreatobacter aquaticus]|uniref:Riboflavin biosynthesis protein n=1 Tax=Phreatobacter aquaticus TaxID=2570229 RepID=A0A4D7QKZ3_9HYPH|nr:bifunctional riboflavin kinase/FAD synthetase [Phreatobacter aquaticus]QCK86026.1 bifunctional riboflavin kinase/FAD synthetase [Phreatobacter aquaticus]
MPLTLPPSHSAADAPVFVRPAPLPVGLAGGVVAIGNFDGVHRGHQHVIATAMTQARRTGSPTLALTFEPHPRAFFQPDRPMFRLTDPATKFRLLAGLGVDGIACAPFDRDFAALSAEAFIADVLVGWLQARAIVVGGDFHYGAGRRGTPDSLVKAGAIGGFDVIQVQPFSVDGVLASSTAIREALTAGRIDVANRLLGHAWSVSGEVIHGAKLGRTLGFPTANLALAPATELAHGIYAVKIAIGGVWHDGVASFGRRPTVDNGPPLLEVHVFDFAGDLYGQIVDVAFGGYIRPEKKFDDLNALVVQMHDDSNRARALLAGTDLPKSE